MCSNTAKSLDITVKNRINTCQPHTCMLKCSSTTTRVENIPPPVNSLSLSAGYLLHVPLRSIHYRGCFALSSPVSLGITVSRTGDPRPIKTDRDGCCFSSRRVTSVCYVARNTADEGPADSSVASRGYTNDAK